MIFECDFRDFFILAYVQFLHAKDFACKKNYVSTTKIAEVFIKLRHITCKIGYMYIKRHVTCKICYMYIRSL